MKKLSKSLIVFFAIVLVCSVVPIGNAIGIDLPFQTLYASALDTDSGVCGDNVSWTLDNGTLTVSGEGAMYDYEKDAALFAGCDYNVEKVVIEPGITYIGAYCFAFLDSMKKIEIPDTVTQIGSGAFFGSTAVDVIAIPKNVTTIGDYAFMNCTGLKRLILPRTVTAIGDYVFEGCTNVKHITFAEPELVKGLDNFETIEYLRSLGRDHIEMGEGNEEYLATKTVHFSFYDHIFEPEKIPTCTESGYTAAEWCDECEGHVAGGEYVPSVPHKDDSNDGKCDYCGYPTGLTIHEDEERTITVHSPEVYMHYYYILFTPERTGKYVFKSPGNYPMSVKLYDDEHQLIDEFFYHDSDDYNFILSGILEAGVTYRCYIELLSGDFAKIDVILTCDHNYQRDVASSDYCQGKYSYICSECGKTKLLEKNPYHTDENNDSICDTCKKVLDGYYLTDEMSLTRYWLGWNEETAEEFKNYTFFYHPETEKFDVYSDNFLYMTYDISEGKLYAGDVLFIDESKKTQYLPWEIIGECIATPGEKFTGNSMSCNISTKDYWLSTEDDANNYVYNPVNGDIYLKGNFVCPICQFNPDTMTLNVCDWYIEMVKKIYKSEGYEFIEVLIEGIKTALFEQFLIAVNPPVPEAEGRNIYIYDSYDVKNTDITSCSQMYITNRSDCHPSQATLYNTENGNYVLISVDNHSYLNGTYGVYVESSRYDVVIEELSLDLCSPVAHTNENEDRLCDVCGDYVDFVIRCYADSPDHQYAIYNGFDHTLIDSTCDDKCGVHNIYENEYIAPTCTANGYMGGKVCLDCEKVFETPEIVPASGHSPKTLTAVMPTCTQSGFTEGVICETCGEVLSGHEIIQTTGHTDFDDDGICDICGEKTGSDSDNNESFIERFINRITSIIDRIIALFRRLFG